MWIGDMVTQLPADSSIVMVADFSSKNKGVSSKKILGVCETIQGKESIRPTYDVQSYMYRFRQVDGFIAGARVRVIATPKEGVLELELGSDPNDYWYSYTPNSSDLHEYREDSFVMEVENHGVMVEIRYYINIESPEEVLIPLCDKDSWKISLNPAPDYTSDIQSLLTFTGISNSV